LSNTELTIVSSNINIVSMYRSLAITSNGYYVSIN